MIRSMAWAAALLVSTFAVAQDATTVTLKKLVEKRELSLEKSPFSGWDNGIELYLHVDGPNVVGATKYGKLKATSAVDDTGTDLTKKSGDAPSGFNGYQQVQKSMNFGQPNAPRPTGFDVHLRLPATSSRTAHSIPLVTGELIVLVGGDAKTVEVKNLKSAMGNPIDDPVLKDAGLTFTLIDPAKRGVKDKMLGGLMAGGGKGLPAVITGDFDVIESVDILDAAGIKLSNGSFYNDDGGTRSITYMTEKPIPEDAVLKIKVNVGQKKVAVAFELKDVKLP